MNPDAGAPARDGTPVAARAGARTDAKAPAPADEQAGARTDAAADAHAARWRRIRWRARRGLLENDILLTRFLERHDGRLDDEQLAALDELLDLTDRDLLDALLERPPAADAPALSAGARTLLLSIRQP